jgi:hypothetical protein
MHLRLALVLILAGTQAHAASVRMIAGLLEAAPGGGVFAGSGFVGSPAAGGDGYVAFRSLVADGSTSEQIVLARMTPGAGDRDTVASIGRSAPDGFGTYTSFVGNPAVNANGDVAFVATLADATTLPADPDLPAPAALFVYERASGVVSPRVLARQATAAGAIAFVESFAEEADVVVTGRTPAINAAGDIAFTAATRLDAATAGGAVFLLPAGGVLGIVAQTGDTLGTSTFVGFGPPALNEAGTVAFRGRLTGAGAVDGVFRSLAGVRETIARDGDSFATTQPVTRVQTVTEFADAVAIAEDGTVAFLASPVYDFSFVEPGTPPDASVAGFGLLAGDGVTIEPLAYPGQALEEHGRITDVRLQSEFTSEPPGARYAPDGTVVAYVTLNGGNSEALVRIEADADPTTLIVLGGTSPTPSPVGGSYHAAAAAPAVDGVGGIVLVSRLTGGPVSDALIYDPPLGASTFIVAGEAASDGAFAGPAFSNPVVNGPGDVVFRAFVANGPAGLGLFRWRSGQLGPVVRVGDPAPVTGSPPFTNIVGEHDVNDAGTIVFSAVAADLGRGIYTVGPNGFARVAAVGDPGPAGLGTSVTFVSLAGNPGISDDGTVAFRARVQFTDGGGATRRRDGIFVRAGNQVRTLFLAGERSSENLPFYRFGELALRRGVRVAFTATLGESAAVEEGLFVGDLTSLATVGLVGDSLGGDLAALAGRPAIDRTGTVTMLGQVGTINDRHAAILRGTLDGIGRVVEVGDEGATGGVIRSLGRPSVNDAGRAVFRVTFVPSSGGIGGLYLEDGGVLAPFVSIGDAAPATIGGRFSSFNQRAVLAGDDTLAFIASLSGGDVDNGLFVASPSALRVKRLRIKLGTSTKADKMTLQGELDPGSFAAGLDPGAMRLTLGVHDSGSGVWTQVVPQGGLLRRRGAYVFRAPPDVGTIAIRVLRRSGRVKLKVRAQPDFSAGGVFPFEPPARVRLELGDVSGQAVLDCTTRGRRLACSS